MKKILLIALALAMLLCLAACGDFVSILPGADAGPEAEETGAPETDNGPDAVFEECALLAFLGWETFGESYYTDTPLALSYQPLPEGSGCRSYVFDRASIIAGCDALRAMTVTGKTQEEAVSSEEYVFTRADGPEYRLTFGLLADGTRVISTYTGTYMISGGEGLWSIVFPAYSPSYDVFDLYFRDDVRRFADEFYENTPVSVSYRMNSGATITSTDPEAVTAAFQALANSAVIVVENQPDQNVDLNQIRDYIFTMEDGTAYTFRFAQRCLAVTANAAFGPVYYWIDGVDILWNVDITPEDTSGKFQGGKVWQLREDTKRAAQVVDGTLEGISVAGIYVDYTIEGESGYLTLNGDTALKFLRRMCTVGVSADMTDAPAGDVITVSVTLSDGTGPILYFTGDSIQQVVGIHYICDSADMQDFRDLILQLAAEGYNTAVVVNTEGTTD